MNFLNSMNFFCVFSEKVLRYKLRDDNVLYIRYNENSRFRRPKREKFGKGDGYEICK